MMVYVVTVHTKQFRACRVSQEAHKTIEAAQEFCMSRTGAEKLNDWAFESDEYYYGIHEVSVKE